MKAKPVPVTVEVIAAGPLPPTAPETPPPPPAPPTPPVAPPTAPTRPAGLEAALRTVSPGARAMYEVLAAAGGEVTTDQLVADHGWKRATVKDWATKLAAAKLIDRPRDGVYVARKLAAA